MQCLYVHLQSLESCSCLILGEGGQGACLAGGVPALRAWRVSMQRPTLPGPKADKL